MALKQNFELMARYNQWMNENIYRAASGLDPAQLVEDRGAFFGSILGTLNHILVGDTIWLKRFASHPAQYRSLEYVRSLPMPDALSDILYEEFEPLRTNRQTMDDVIVEFSREVDASDLDSALSYRSMAGTPNQRSFGQLIHHFYNHQTHHRGQVSTLFSQIGVDVGVTDLLELIPDVQSDC